MASRKYLAAIVALLATVAAAPIASAQTEEEEPSPPVSSLTVVTPYPSVAVEPGDQVSFVLTIGAPSRTQVSLSAEGTPEGWTAAFRGGGFEVDSVTAGPGVEPEVSFDVTVPVSTSEGSYDFTVTAAGGGETVQLPLQVRISEQAGGEVTLTPNFPGLRTPAGQPVTFDVEINNGTPADLEFELAPSGPAGWDVTAELSGEAAASTIQVEAGGSETINVEVTPPATAEAAQYPVTLQANAASTQVETEMIVEVTGSFSLEMSTPDERLNAEVTVGSSSDLQLLLTNSGTAPLDEVTVGVTPPSGWEVTFDNQTVAIQPGETVPVTATITPSEEAVAGDYVISFTATHEQADDSMEVRTTVNPSAVWGFVGIAVIALTLAGLAWVFRRFGRR
ncbi:MAG: NEW3 domain-containing protein [Acidimicrobiia bacterium]